MIEEVYFGNDAVRDISLNAIAEFNGIGNGNGEKRLRRRLRSRAQRRWTSLLFHSFKIYHQIFKLRRKRYIRSCFCGSLFCESERWQICNYWWIHGRFWEWKRAEVWVVSENQWRVVVLDVAVKFVSTWEILQVGYSMRFNPDISQTGRVIIRLSSLPQYIGLINDQWFKSKLSLEFLLSSNKQKWILTLPSIFGNVSIFW